MIEQKKMMQKLCVLLMGALIASFSFASTYSVLAIEGRATENETKVNPGSNVPSISDKIELAAANVNGISVNKFSTFHVGSNGLTLLQGQFERADHTPAKTIVIQANAITVEGEIALLGAPADILFVLQEAGDDNSLLCEACGFSNFGRVTLAAANLESELNNSVTSIGQLTTYSGGAIALGSVAAEGVLSLEFIAESVTSTENSTVVTNLKGTKSIFDGNKVGYEVRDNGELTIGSGGINLYNGGVKVRYETLDAEGVAGLQSSEQQLNGSFQASMISIINARPIAISSNGALSTKSDVLTTSSYEGRLVASLEGIYFESLIDGQAGVRIDGELTSDNKIQVVTGDGIQVGGSISAEDVILTASGSIIVSSNGSINASTLNLDADWVANKGGLNGIAINLLAEHSIYNHFGGRIVGDQIVLSSVQGTVINGSRTNKLYTPLIPSALNVSAELFDNKAYGIYSQVKDEIGTSMPDMSASILANHIGIRAKRVENINPYYITKVDGWVDTSIPLVVQKSRQVVMQAEAQLSIVADEYLLNASAIIGVNQAGSFDVHAKRFINQRYHIEAQLGVYSRSSFKGSGQTGEDLKLAAFNGMADIETRISAYSPPGVMYSFGGLTYSDGTPEQDTEAAFINQFSYLEVIRDATFQDVVLDSIGLTVAARAREGGEPIRCATYGCSAKEYLSQVEFETLTSFSGSVYGLSTELAVTTVNTLEAIKQEKIDDFINKRKVQEEKTELISSHIGYDGAQVEYTVRLASYRAEVNSNGVEILVISFAHCDRVKPHLGNISTNCFTRSETHFVDDLVFPDAKDSLMHGTQYTYDEINAKVVEYLAGRDRWGDLATSEGPVSGRYAQQLINFVTDDKDTVELIQVQYVEKFFANNVGTLSEAEARTAGYYANYGDVAVRIDDLMGVQSVSLEKPSKPRLANSSVDETTKTASYTVEWDSIAGSNFDYVLNGENLGLATAKNFSLGPLKGEVVKTYTLKVCTSTKCSPSSDALRVEFNFRPVASDFSVCSDLFFSPFYVAKNYRQKDYYCTFRTENNTRYVVVAKEAERLVANDAWVSECMNIYYYTVDSMIDAVLAKNYSISPSKTGTYKSYKNCVENLGFPLTHALDM